MPREFGSLRTSGERSMEQRRDGRVKGKAGMRTLGPKPRHRERSYACRTDRVKMVVIALRYAHTDQKTAMFPTSWPRPRSRILNEQSNVTRSKLSDDFRASQKRVSFALGRE